MTFTCTERTCIVNAVKVKVTEWPPNGKIAAHSAYEMFSWYKYQGPVVQSIVSLTISLRHKFVKQISAKVTNTLLFFVEKNVRILCSAKDSHIFSTKNNSAKDSHIFFNKK